MVTCLKKKEKRKQQKHVEYKLHKSTVPDSAVAQCHNSMCRMKTYRETEPQITDQQNDARRRDTNTIHYMNLYTL